MKKIWINKKKNKNLNFKKKKKNLIKKKFQEKKTIKK
jgi:hypothetical protein